MTSNLYHTIHELSQTNLVKVGISMRSGGVSVAPFSSLNLATHVGDNPAAVLENQQIFSFHTGINSLKYCKQVHSDTVINADTVPNSCWNYENQDAPINIGDALVSTQSGIALGVYTADCVPIFILDISTPAIGMAHAGWRGTYARIAVKTLSVMTATFGTLTENCHIHLGPSIQKCCYEVSSDLLVQFEEEFGQDVHDGKYLSLQNANVSQLVDVGVPSESISVSPYCTACNTDNYYSYRAEEGETGRMVSFIQLI